VLDDEEEIPTLKIDPRWSASRPTAQCDAAKRDGAEVERTLGELKAAAAGDANLMPHFLDAARARASKARWSAALQEVFGTYTESPVF